MSVASQTSAVQIVNVTPLSDESAYLKPLRVYYKMNEKTLIWDCMKTHDSVAILIFNITRNVLVFVRQFRPAVLMSAALNSMNSKLDNVKEKSQNCNPQLGYTLELCAGIIDKQGLSPQEIALEEVIEETGYSPPLNSLELVTSCRTGVGISGALQYIYYCQVDDSIRVSKGGGIEDESIEVVELTVEEAKRQVYECDHVSGLGRTAGFRFAVSWFVYEKYPSLKLQGVAS